MKGLPRWVRGERAIVLKKKKKKRRGRAGVKELQKQNISHPGRAEYNAFCAAGRGQSPHTVTSIYALPRKSRTMKSLQSDPF